MIWPQDFHSLAIRTWCIFQSLNSYHNNMILFWVLYCCKTLLCLLLGNMSVFSSGHSAMSSIIIGFILQSCWYYWKILDFHITLMQDGLEQTFAAVLPYENRFYERYKAGCSEIYPDHENLLHHCCEQVKSSVTDVFTNYFICSFKWWSFETNTCM